VKLIYRKGLFHGDRSIGSRHDGEIKDNGSEFQIYEKLQTARADEMGDLVRSPTARDRSQTKKNPRSLPETKGSGRKRSRQREGGRTGFFKKRED